MTTLIATSVVRGSDQGESHGGIYLINLDNHRILNPVDWNTVDIDWQGRGWDRGLRGVAFSNDYTYVAASDEIFLFDQGFNIVDSFSNPYLKHCHEICVHENRLFVTSTGFDSILGLNLETKEFDWALKIAYDGITFAARRFDPQSESGPLMLNKLHLNNVHCNQGGMYISGARTKALLKFTGKSVGVATTLPEGVHNARPHLDGIVFNDTRSDAVRFESPTERKAFRVPRYPPHKLTHADVDDSRIARQGFGRGLCVLSDREIAAGSSPSTVSLYNLDQRQPLRAFNLSLDIRNAIHGLQVWPYPWPG
ncbi:MAG: hypothetical protein AAF417_18275 [Pseudomonadota bacterium]